MKSRTHVLIAFFSAMAVTLVAVSDMRRTSPGPLSAVHQREPDLDGRNDCSACHGGWFGTLREACLECHAEIGTALTEGTGLHGTLGPRAEQCGLCHAEHHGAGAQLVHKQSFALAGVMDVERFEHATIGFAMDGAHLELDCTQCHANARTALLGQGQKRFLGLDQDCVTCHEDPHAGKFSAACASCHGQTTWDGLFSLGHERVLPLVGGHGDLDCAACHAADGPHALELVAGRGARPGARTCVECHESPHSGPFVAGVAAQVNLAPGASCVTCHRAEHASFHELDLLEMTPEQHAPSGFPLDAPHDQAACTDCHDPGRPRFAARYPGRSAERCNACHADPHGGQFAEGPFADPAAEGRAHSPGGDCLACHERTQFEPHAFTAGKHALAALPLEGAHLDLECEACHERRAEDQPRLFRGTPSDCDACHRDAHGGFFARFVAGESTPEHGECARCHDATSFARAERSFDHERWTGFAVAGAHAEGECAACHELAPEPDETGRSFGRVQQLFGPFEGCATCHEDAHAGRFAGEDLPARVEGRGTCARCHADSSFRALARDFDHGFWTGFTLVEEHGEARCSACHAPLAGRDENGRTSAFALGAGCADCHEDPHAGQFEQTENGCARCHDDEYESFLSFDHERDARFALGEAHQSLECSACHATEARQGLEFVRYRPLGIECADCHGNQTEVLLRRRSKAR